MSAPLHQNLHNRRKDMNSFKEEFRGLLLKRECVKPP